MPDQNPDIEVRYIGDSHRPVSAEQPTLEQMRQVNAAPGLPPRRVAAQPRENDSARPYKAIADLLEVADTLASEGLYSSSALALHQIARLAHDTASAIGEGHLKAVQRQLAGKGDI